MGKTTLLFHLLHKLQGTAKTAFIFQTQCTSHELLRQLLSEFECDTSITDPVRISRELKSILLAEANAGRRCVLIIDEAQNLGPEVLETIRLLSNFETPRRKLLNIILSGQAELGEMLDSSDLRQLRQRLSCIAHLQRFTPGETALYIAHRLTTAGYPGKVSALFSLHALTRIAQLSEGIPRVVNNICFNALSLGYALEVSQIDSEIIEEVAGDLGLSGRRRPVSSEAAHSVVVSASGQFSGEAIVRCKQEVSDALSTVPEPCAQKELGLPPAPGVEMPAEALDANVKELPVNSGERFAAALNTVSKWPEEISRRLSNIRRNAATENIRRNAATESELTVRPRAGTAIHAMNSATSPRDASTDETRKRNQNQTKLFVTGGSACLLALCITPAIHFFPQVSARAASSTSISSVSARAYEDHAPTIPSHAIDRTTTKASARDTSNPLSKDAAESTANRRPEIANQPWRARQDKKMLVDLALASFAPEPLITLAPLRPMPVSARSVFGDKADSYSTVRSTSPILSAVKQQTQPLMYVPPHAIWQPAPQYPSTVRRRNRRIDDVQLLLSIASNGEVDKVSVLSGNGYLAAAAMEAVKTWRYSPAVSNGSPVESQVYITVQFRPR